MEEPTVMFCRECMYKHLRDLEHHLEDAVRVTSGSERNYFEGMIDTLRNYRKEIFSQMLRDGQHSKNLSELKKKCTTCGCKG